MNLIKFLIKYYYFLLIKSIIYMAINIINTLLKNLKIIVLRIPLKLLIFQNNKKIIYIIVLLFIYLFQVFNHL
jgi:hypothetical protein